MKKILVLVLMICLFFTLSACTNKKAETSSSVSSSISEEETSDYNSTINENEENILSNSEVSLDNSSTNNKDTDKASSNVSKSQTPVHKHSFSTATCIKPATCACGLIQGSTVGHTWIDATCSAPKTCNVCKITDGTAIEHSFEGGKCRYCGESESMLWYYLEKDLSNKFKNIDIGIDTWYLSFSVYGNTSSVFPYDFSIKVDWDASVWPSDIETSIIYTAEEKAYAKSKLKDFQMQLYEYLINKYPHKKFECGYRKSGWKYPSIKEGYWSISLCSWKNFNNQSNNYYEATQTGFYWDNSIDDYKF